MGVDLSLLSDEELLEKTGLEVIPLTKDVGAEVLGVDLSTKLGKSSFETIRRAWLEHGVLVIRNQSIDPDAFVAFSSRFGESDNAPVMENSRAFVDGYPELFVISNVVKNGLRSALGRAGIGMAYRHGLCRRAAHGELSLCR